MMLRIVEPSTRDAGPILVTDEAHNDIAEFFHSEHATVPQSYETALQMAKVLVSLPYMAQAYLAALSSNEGAGS
jgi:hypothetical protein